MPDGTAFLIVGAARSDTSPLNRVLGRRSKIFVTGLKPVDDLQDRSTTKGLLRCWNQKRVQMIRDLRECSQAEHSTERRAIAGPLASYSLYWCHNSSSRGR